jgi:ParB-like chromosome segregation protein Spo0J
VRLQHSRGDLSSRGQEEVTSCDEAEAIREWGWTNPILVGADGDVIAGHARLMAARKLRMTEVPVIVLCHLSEAQKRALVIADNQLGLNA